VYFFLNVTLIVYFADILTTSVRRMFRSFDDQLSSLDIFLQKADVDQKVLYSWWKEFVYGQAVEGIVEVGGSLSAELDVVREFLALVDKSKTVANLDMPAAQIATALANDAIILLDGQFPDMNLVSTLDTIGGEALLRVKVVVMNLALCVEVLAREYLFYVLQQKKTSSSTLITLLWYICICVRRIL